MLIEELRAHYGNWTILTRKLELANTTYLDWNKKGYIPYRTQCFIQVKTGGLFKADENHAKPQK